jgi:hypothetical protein
MRIKADDLRKLMDYLDKECVEFVDILVVDSNFASYFTFNDAEERECEITIYDSMREMEPDLTKKMQLKTRLKKGENT